MGKDIAFRQWRENFEKGLYDSKDFKTQCDAGWYDWFCNTKSLGNKTKKLGSIVMGISEGGKVDFDKHYVWFKNNCPCAGPLYDDFRFADIETGDVQFTTSVKDERDSARYVVYGRRNNFNGPLFETNFVRELKKWFSTPWGE